MPTINSAKELGNRQLLETVGQQQLETRTHESQNIRPRGSNH